MTESSPAGRSSAVSIAAGVGAGVVGVGLWMLLYKGSSAGFGILGWLGGPLIGAGVGLAMRLAGGAHAPAPAVAWSAVGITLVSAGVGYVLTDLYLVPWVPPSTLTQAIKHLTSDIQALLLIGIGCYIAWIASRRPA